MRKAFSKLTALLPIAALMGGLSLAAVSCSDDELSEEEKQQQAEEQAEQGLNDAAEFWNVVGQLTDDPMPDEGWQTATYAPSIGEPDGANTAVRIVATNDAETAAARFAMLTGADIDESTTDYTYQNEHVGTLRYHRTGGQSLAVVDVDIKQMPGLSQIVYQAPEGDNGYFNGTAYYRFGDVVKKLNSDGQYDYWICVRPAFGPAKKGDSHWISVSKIPSANTKQVTKIINKEKVTHSLPKSLTTNREHMQNLAEMLYAMTHAQQWASNLSTNNGYKTLKYFRDFNYVQLFKYNDDQFFNDVADNWESRGLFKTVFGLNRNDLTSELNHGLNLVYSSATMSGNKILLPVATYNGTNLKTETLAKTNSEWTTAFDIQTLMNPGYISYNDATGQKQKAWLVRYATGATLCKGSQEAASFDKYKRLTNCEDVFVYNKDVDNLDMNNLKNIEPRVFRPGIDEPTYYHCGDIVRYQNRYYVCASKHNLNGTARFITLNDQETHTTSTCHWEGYGDDVVYNDDMASSETLAAWIQNILMDDARWTEILGVMQDRGLSNYTLQVVPQSDVVRKDVVKGLFSHENIVTEMYQPDALAHDAIPAQAYFFGEQINWDEKTSLVIGGVTDKLLADKFRWEFFAIGSNEYWVPNVVCVTDNEYEEITNYISSRESQSCSHFQWKTLARSIPNTSDVTKKTNYNIVLLAMHWDHTSYLDKTGFTYYVLLDFTKDRATHPKQSVRDYYEKNPDIWGRRSITSRELTFTDTGLKNSNCESVWVAKER